MYAAAEAADETVAFLLSKGASPDLMNKNGNTALGNAIRSMCSSTIDLLAPVTQEGLEGALENFANWPTELTPAIKELLIPYIHQMQMISCKLHWNLTTQRQFRSSWHL